MTQPRTNYVVLDLEATCWERGQEEARSGIIAIGAMVYTPGQSPKSPLPEFQAFVRPKFAPVLSEFCTQLTSICQDQVDPADGLPEVLATFHRWAEGFASCKLASWGEYDRKQVARDCQLHRISNPFQNVPHVNLKAVFSQLYGRRKKKDSLGQALRRAGLERIGTAHRGIDDVRNIVRIVQCRLDGVL